MFGVLKACKANGPHTIELSLTLGYASFAVLDEGTTLQQYQAKLNFEGK